MSIAAGRPVAPFVTRLVIAAVLLGAGVLLRQASRVQDLVANALERQSTLPASPSTALEDAERELGLVGRVPVLGPAVSRDIAHRRAEALYWSGNYADLLVTDLDPEAEAATDPEMAALRTSATFRTLQRGKLDQTVVKQLDGVLARYAQVLRQAPELVDVAYNYEVVARIRDAAAKGRFTDLQPEDESAQGDKGAPPPQTAPAEFNVIVPLRPDERQDQFDAGTGGVPVRKG